MENLNKAGVRKPHRLAKILTPIMAVVVLSIGLALYSNLTGVFSPQWFSDKLTVAIYQPTPEIIDLADNSGMNDGGRFYFYAAAPQVNDREDFNINCASVMNEESYVLGCFDGQIYLFNVTDQRISGIKYVTAAHEMLHVAYDRLGSIDRQHVDNLLEEQLQQTTDQRILDLVELYDRTEPGERLNELHSIFGSEIWDLSDGLNEYYSRYFADRSKTTTASEQYEGIFSSLENHANELEAKMAVLQSEIDTMSAQYDSDVAQLSADISSFNSLASTPGGFASQSAFNAQRSQLLSRQNQLDAAVDAINAKVSEYNSYVAELQTLGRESESLQTSIDSQSLLLEE
jgi:hypothetical protein